MQEEEIPTQIVPTEPIPEPVPEVTMPQEPVVAPVAEPVQEPIQVTVQEPISEVITPTVVPQQNTIIDHMKNMLAKSLFAIQTNKNKKLDRIITLFDKHNEITNDQVEKLLRVSDATATRYLEILVKENKITKIGTRGKYVSYKKI